MRLLVWLALAAMVGGTVSADARMHAPYRGHRIAPSTAAPLDAFATPAGAYSLRKLKSTYAGPGIKLRRATGGTQDIGFLGFTGFTGAPLDVAAATAFCAATTCFVDTFYDQSGAAQHLVQATAANQPQFVFNCVNSLPCFRFTATTQYLGSVGTIGVVSPLSASVVARHAVRAAPGGSNACQFFWLTNNSLAQHADLDVLFMSNGSATINLAATYPNWHSVTGVYSGASAVGRVDAVETTGTVAASLGPNNIYIQSVEAGATCDQGELIVWNGYGLTAGERAALSANQKGFWGF